MAKLEDRLRRLRESARERLPAEVREVLHRVVHELKESGLAERALGAGDRSPDFTLPDSRGETVSSVDLRERGPLVVTFYRGVW